MGEHSAKYNKVRSHFLNGYWTEDMVRAAAKSQKKKAAWITAAEAEEIIAEAAKNQ